MIRYINTRAYSILSMREEQSSYFYVNKHHTLPKATGIIEKTLKVDYPNKGNYERIESEALEKQTRKRKSSSTKKTVDGAIARKTVLHVNKAVNEPRNNVSARVTSDYIAVANHRAVASPAPPPI